MPSSPVRLEDFLAAQAEINALSDDLADQHTPTAAIDVIPRLLAHPCIRHSAAKPLELAGDLAHSLADLGRYDDAIEAWEAAIAAGYSSAPHPRAYVAESLVLSGNVTEGMELFDELVLQCPDDPWLRSAAGITCVLAGDHKAALRWFEEGVELSIAHGDSDRILNQLVELAGGARTSLGLDDNEELTQQIEAMEAAPAGTGRHWNETDPAPAAPADGCPACGYEVACDAPDGLDPSDDPGITWGAVAAAEEPVSLPPGGADTDPFGLVDILFGSGEAPVDDQSNLDAADPDAANPDGANTGAAVLKIGRNQPCSCGSGRKSKHCCG